MSIQKAEFSDAQPAPVPEHPANDRLDSWKEIALYLNRDVRTVRRWESNQGLPVRRHQHQKGASVYAYRSEIEVWWKGEQQRLKKQGADSVAEVSVPRRRWVWWTAGGCAAVFLLAVGLLVARSFRAKSPAPAAKIMLVVLPFQNLTGEPAQDFVSDGLTEEMTAQVSGLHHDRLAVIARTSSMAYKDTRKPVSEIGRELGVDYVLEGSVRNSGDKVRVTAQLIQVHDQTHVWAQDFDGDRHDILKLQSETAQAVAQEIRSHLLASLAATRSPNQRTIDAHAYELYVQGRHYLDQRSRDSIPRSIDSFKQAIAQDAGYAAAYAGLADAYNLLTFYGLDPTMNSVSQAKIAADKALQLDNSLAAAHAAEAYTEFMWQGNWSAAEKEFQRALELDDNYVPTHQWYALYLAARGRTDESVNEMRYAKKLDPLSPGAHAGLAYMQYFARNYDLANESARTALQLNPNSTPAHAVLGWSYTEQKKYPEAIKELQTAADLSGNAPIYLAAMARTRALSGDRDRAMRILAHVQPEQSQPQGSGTALASAYLAAGEQESALRWLEQTAVGDIQANWLRVDPAFDSVRDNPRFIAVVNRIGATKD